MSVCFCCMFVYISLYTCPFARLFVHLSHVGILSTVDTTQHIRNFYRATHMHSAGYAVATCLSDHSSLCLSDSPSVCHTTGLPPCTHVFSFCICFPVHLPIHHIHTHNVFHICLCFCVHMSVYHVHSYVSVCLSATTIRPFRTFLRLSVDLRVFVYVYFHANILHVQLFVRLFVTFVRHPLNTCLCV